MKITIVNTSDIRGGAAIAAFRLFKVIHEKFPGTRMLAREKLSLTMNVRGLNNTFWQRFFIKFRFVLEAISFIYRSKSREDWFAFSTACAGQNISHLPEIRDADLIHLHWINSGFLSLKNISEIADTGKPVVWTLHDMWAFTGGCHYSGSCINYLENCGNCLFLKSPGSKDLSYRIHREKQKLWASANISFIAVSYWMAECARKSSLAGSSRIVVIPNPIDTEVYKPADKATIRDELGLPQSTFLILAGAANLQDKRKGFVYLMEALRQMKETIPEIGRSFGLITFGKASNIDNSPVEYYPQSYLKDDYAIARLYQAADVFVLPTLEDNLPGTVMESLACGTPVVAFNVGGIPDMIDHKTTGYLAELKNVSDLIEGINWVKSHPMIQQVEENCRKKVVENFSNEVVAAKYIDFYRSLIQ